MIASMVCGGRIISITFNPKLGAYFKHIRICHREKGGAL